MTKRTRREVIGAAALSGVLVLAASFYYAQTHQIQGKVAVWEDLEGRGVPRFFREALPRQATNIRYYYDGQGYGQAVFSISEREFLAWVAKRGWSVTRVRGGLLFDVEPLLSGIRELTNGYEGDIERDEIWHTVYYSINDCTAYYIGIVGH
jgi:hypothetical protein